MNITVTLPDDLAAKVRLMESELPQIIELGIRHWPPGGDRAFEGVRDVVEALAELPAPEDVLRMRPSPALQSRITELLAKSRAAGLTSAERGEWEQYEFVEHVVRVAKARAALKLKQKPPVHE